MQSEVGRLRSVFAEIAGDDGLVDARELSAALKIDNDLLARRLFELFDLDGSGRIQPEEFLDVVTRLRQAAPTERIRFAFRLHDLDDSGAISRSELDRLIRAALEQSHLLLTESQIEALVDALLLEADSDADGVISEDEFSATLGRWPDVRDALAVGPMAWLQPAGPSPAPKSERRPIKNWIWNRFSAIGLTTLWGGASAAFFAHGFLSHAEHGLAMQIGRGCGAALNFNGMLILLPMMRTTLTRIRQSRLGRVLPVDDAIDFHRWVGHTMFGLAVVHTVAHLINYSTLQTPVIDSLIGTPAGLTGLLLMGVFTVMVITAQQAIRKREYFEVF